jgi:hypothetical protein
VDVHLVFFLYVEILHWRYRVLTSSKGSADGGVTINEDPEVFEMMRSVSSVLNLKGKIGPILVIMHNYPTVFDVDQAAVTYLCNTGHRVKEQQSMREKFIYGPVDLEGHRGKDGR